MRKARGFQAPRNCFTHPASLAQVATMFKNKTQYFFLAEHASCFGNCLMNRIIWEYCMLTSSNGYISASLTICAGNSPVTGEFTAQRPVTRSFDVLFFSSAPKFLRRISLYYMSMRTLFIFDIKS